MYSREPLPDLEPTTADIIYAYASVFASAAVFMAGIIFTFFMLRRFDKWFKDWSAPKPFVCDHLPPVYLSERFSPKNIFVMEGLLSKWNAAAQAWLVASANALTWYDIGVEYVEVDGESRYQNVRNGTRAVIPVGTTVGHFWGVLEPTRSLHKCRLPNQSEIRLNGFASTSSMAFIQLFMNSQLLLDYNRGLKIHIQVLLAWFIRDAPLANCRVFHEDITVSLPDDSNGPYARHSLTLPLFRVVTIARVAIGADLTMDFKEFPERRVLPHI